jgi:hypothetical protein
MKLVINLKSDLRRRLATLTIFLLVEFLTLSRRQTEMHLMRNRVKLMKNYRDFKAEEIKAPTSLAQLASFLSLWSSKRNKIQSLVFSSHGRPL